MIQDQKFLDSISFNDNGCWEWTRGKNGKGYGNFCSNSKVFLAHRYSWEITNGPIPQGMQVLHKCDNRTCVNPGHLFLGTHQDNMNDMVNKGRQAHSFGEKSACHKLNEEDALNIIRLRKQKLTYKDIASQFGVDSTTIRDICTGRRWKYLQGGRGE